MESGLNEYEVRVIATLLEKQITTPDYYPMTLNALVNACNQKNNRHPVVAYDTETVTRALDSLREKKLAFVFYGSEARVAKFGHVFPKAYDLSPQETAVMCVLMLRGPQTAGEIRSRSANLHSFESLEEVESTLEGLTARIDPALVTRLARQPGTKEPRYAQLFCGDVELAPSETTLQGSANPPKTRLSDERMTALEGTVAALRRELDELKAHYAEFRKQFE